MTEEKIQLRIEGAADLPPLIYLPGLHGDWTLVSSFRAAMRGHVRFIEFTYPRTTDWTLDEYAGAVVDALAERGVTGGWLLGESFSSQVVWAIVARANSDRRFAISGIVLAGGFARYPFFLLARLTRFFNRIIPMWLLRLLLRGYAGYARLRHRRAPETLACVAEFVDRRTEEDRRAILHRYGLILSSGGEEIARRCELPVYCLSGLVDPVVPWPFVLPWFRRHCPGFRGSRVIFNADHNVLGTAPAKAAAQVREWMGAR
jgi:pimeloyl-ACP methyl ester carboxylesterase